MRDCDVNTCDVNSCQYQDEACSNCLTIHRDVPDDPEIYLRGWQDAANLPEQSRAFFEVAALDAAPRGCEALSRKNLPVKLQCLFFRPGTALSHLPGNRLLSPRGRKEKRRMGARPAETDQQSKQQFLLTVLHSWYIILTTC